MFVVDFAHWLFIGRRRTLSRTNYSSLKSKLSSSQNTISGAVTVTAECVGDISDCTMFRTSEVSGRCTIVAATPQYISVIQYSNSRKEFTVVQVS